MQIVRKFYTLQCPLTCPSDTGLRLTEDATPSETILWLCTDIFDSPSCLTALNSSKKTVQTMFSLPEASTTQSNTSALPTLAASLLLRLAFFGLCRAYVQRLLVADLQQVADEDDGANHTPSRGSYELLDASRNGQSPSASRTRRSGYASDSDASSHSTTRDKRLADVESGSSAKASIASANWAGLMSTTTFCCTFSESCTLCTLVLTANITGER